MLLTCPSIVPDAAYVLNTCLLSELIKSQMDCYLFTQLYVLVYNVLFRPAM